MHKWGEFQSLIQLSVALNGAFAVLSTFLSSVIEKAVTITQIHMHHAEHLEEELSDLEKSNNVQLITPFSDLIDNFRRVEELYDNLFITILRQICAYLAIIAIFFSIYASFKFSTRINIFAQYYSVIQMVPFLIGIFYSTYLSGFYLLPNYIERRRLIRKLQQHQQESNKPKHTLPPIPAQTEEV